MGRIWALSIERDVDVESDEAALVAAAQAAPAAFDVLYQRYLARVYRYLRAHVGSDEDAADLTQQVFLQALDALPTPLSKVIQKPPVRVERPAASYCPTELPLQYRGG